MHARCREAARSERALLEASAARNGGGRHRSLARLRRCVAAGANCGADVAGAGDRRGIDFPAGRRGTALLVFSWREDAILRRFTPARRGRLAAVRGCDARTSRSARRLPQAAHSHRPRRDCDPDVLRRHALRRRLCSVEPVARGNHTSVCAAGCICRCALCACARARGRSRERHLRRFDRPVHGARLSQRAARRSAPRCAGPGGRLWRCGSWIRTDSKASTTYSATPPAIACCSGWRVSCANS